MNRQQQILELAREKGIIGVGGELVLDLQVLGWKDDLLALHGAVDQTGHQLLGTLFDLLAVAHRQAGHAPEIVSFQASFQFQPLVLV